MLRIQLALILFFLLISPTYLFADEGGLGEVVSRTKSFQLDNGLKVIYLERALVPVFVGQVWVKVGSADELPGRTGAAHLLEHMAFKGTTTIGTKNYEAEKPLLEKSDRLYESAREGADEKLLRELTETENALAEIWDNGGFTKLYQRHGAVGLNAGTSTDYTMYTSQLPSSELEFWFSIESERLKNPVFRQFYKELEVVKEERRMRFDDVPSGKLMEAVLASAYWGHPYQNMVIGWKSDLDQLRVGDARYLHETYYRPDNMVLVLVGDLRGYDLKLLSEKYFGKLKKPDEVLPPSSYPVQKQGGERIVRVTYSSLPMIFLGFHIPTSPDPDALYFSLLHSILADGEASVFERNLKHKKKIVTSVFTTELPGERYDPIFIIGATPAKGVSYDRVVEAIYSELRDLKEKGVSKEKFEAIKRKTKYTYLSALSSNEGIADIIGTKELLHGDWRIISEEYKTIQEATRENVLSLIDKYLYKDNQTRVEIVSKDVK